MAKIILSAFLDLDRRLNIISKIDLLFIFFNTLFGNLLEPSLACIIILVLIIRIK